MFPLYERAAFRVAVFTAAFLLLAVSKPVWAQEASVTPAQATVAILPCIDRTGEKDQEWRDRQAAAGYRNLVEAIYERGFNIADRAAVTKAIEESKIDFTDEEEYRRDNLIKIGKALNADFVVFSVVLSTQQDTKRGGILSLKGPEIQGKATVKTWVVDVKNEKKIISAEVREGKAAGNSKLFGNNEGRWRRVNAVGNALKEQMADTFLKPYPKVRTVKVNEDGSIPK